MGQSGTQFTYNKVTPEKWAAASAAAAKTLGLTISGNEGDASKGGVTVHYVYSPDAQSATVQCTSKPWIASWEEVNEKLEAFLDAQLQA